MTVMAQRGKTLSTCRIRSCCFFLLVFAKALSSVFGGMMDAEQQAELILASAGYASGLNISSGVYAAIGVSRVVIPDDAKNDEFERWRTLGIKSALLDAKGKLAMMMMGRDESSKDCSLSDGKESLRIVYKAMADARLSGCWELPVAESWSSEGRFYKIAVPVIYNRTWKRNLQYASKEWNNSDKVFLTARINRMSVAQRIGCFRCKKHSGEEYIVAFGLVDVETRQGRQLQKAIKSARLTALGNMAFWLNSVVGVRAVAEEYEELSGEVCDGWSVFCEKVSAKCKYNGFPVNEVASGYAISPITGRKLYWCALGARLRERPSPRR